MCSAPRLQTAPAPPPAPDAAPIFAPPMQTGDITGLMLGQESAPRGFSDLTLKMTPSVSVGKR